MNDQATIQGFLDSRITRVNEYRRVMADTQMILNPLAVSCTILFNNRVLDTYNEGVLTLESSLEAKRGVLTKVSDMHYVQDEALSNILVDVESSTAYTLRITTTDLTRIIRIDDQVQIAGILYTIAKVFPYSRYSDSILGAILYPTDNIPPVRDVNDDGDSDLFDSDLAMNINTLFDFTIAKAQGKQLLVLTADLGTEEAPVLITLDWAVKLVGNTHSIYGNLYVTADDCELSGLILTGTYNGSDIKTKSLVTVIAGNVTIGDCTLTGDNATYGIRVFPTGDNAYSFIFDVDNTFIGFSYFNGADQIAAIKIEEEFSLSVFGTEYVGVTSGILDLPDNIELLTAEGNVYTDSLYNYQRFDSDQDLVYTFLKQESVDYLTINNPTELTRIQTGTVHIEVP